MIVYGFRIKIRTKFFFHKNHPRGMEYSNQGRKSLEYNIEKISSVGTTCKK